MSTGLIIVLILVAAPVLVLLTVHLYDSWTGLNQDD